MKIIIFGRGKFYQNNKKKLIEYMGKDDEIIAYLDNSIDQDLYDSENKIIINPKKICKYEFDYIILMSVYDIDMREQLIDLNIDVSKILSWNQYECMKTSQKNIIWKSTSYIDIKGCKGRILIFSHELVYGGAPMTVWYAAKALTNKGYDVWIATSRYNVVFVNELIEDGCNMIYMPALPYIGEDERKFIQQFDVVLVNTYVLYKLLYYLDNKMPILWWLHEPMVIYETNKISTILHEKMKEVSIYGVSKRAENNFNRAVGIQTSGVLEFGIPDKNCCYSNKKNKIVIATIGSICEIKGQSIICDAFQEIDCYDKKIELWIIGKNNEESYYQKIKEIVKENSKVIFMGEKTQSELCSLMDEIDIVVCPSIEETMSLTIVEGMMYRKLCIASDGAGISDYIVDGQNGYVFETGNKKMLEEKLKYCINNFDNLDYVRDKARKTYEDIFTLDKFGDRLKEVIKMVQDK